MTPGYRHGNASLVFDVDTGWPRRWHRRRRRKSRERRPHITRIYSNSVTVNDYRGRGAAMAAFLGGPPVRFLVAPVDQPAPTCIADIIGTDPPWLPRDGWVDA